MSLSAYKQLQSLCAAALSATALIVSLTSPANASGSFNQASTPPLTPANFIYKVVSAEGDIAYVFGSSHLSPSNAPVQLGACTKKLLAASATVVIESDPISSRQYMDGRPSTLPMSQVLPLLTDTQMQQLHQWVYGVTAHNPDTRLAPLDAFEVIRHLTARQARLRQAQVGWSEHGLDTEIMMAARFLGKATASLETPQEQFAFFKSMTPPMHAQQIGAALATLGSRDELSQSGHMLLKLVQYAATGDEEALLESLGEDLKFVLITSGAELIAGDTLAVAVHTSTDTKCERCWHWRSDVGQDAAHPTICGRCVSNLHGAGEVRTVA